MKVSREEKAMWLEGWKQSGKSVWAYAKGNGLLPQTFYNWIKREDQRASGFVEIPKQIKPRIEKAQGIIIERGDIKIHIPVSIWEEDSKAILEVLKATQ